MKTLNKNKKYVFACYSDQLKLDFKQFCNMQGVKPDYVLRSMMYYFISNYANCVSVIREEKFIDHLYDSYPDLLEAPLLKRFASSDSDFEENI